MDHKESLEGHEESVVQCTHCGVRNYDARMILPSLAGHHRKIRPRQEPNPAHDLYERIAQAGKLELLEKHAQAAATRPGAFTEDTRDLMVALRDARFQVRPHLRQHLLVLFDEKVLLKRELDKAAKITGRTVQNEESVIRALVLTYTGAELARVPYWFPSIHRWLMQWAVDRHHDDFYGVAEGPEVFTAYNGYQLLAQKFQNMRETIQWELHDADASEDGVSPQDALAVKQDHDGGFDLEHQGVLLLRSAGFEVIEVGVIDAFKPDLLVEATESRTALQFHWMTPAGLESVQAFYLVMEHFNARSGIVISPSGYTKAAAQYAASAGITFWDLEDLDRFAKEKVL